MKLAAVDKPSLGTRRRNYRVRPSLIWRIFLVFGSVVFLATAVASVVAVPGISSIFFCSLPLLLLSAVFVKMLRDVAATRDDELQMFESGFVYRSRGKYQSCRWEEINELRRDPKTYELMWVGKKDGELIIFADQSLPETRMIVEAFDAFVLDPANRSTIGPEWDDYRAEISGDA